MDIREIQRLIKIVEKSKIDEIEVEEDKFRIRIAKNSQSLGFDPSLLQSMQLNATASQPAGNPNAVAPVPVAAGQAKDEEKQEKSNRLEVLSPMVGTFYAAPAPDAPPYVKVGDVVKKGQILCIVEAMKLMNEIESDHDGKIVDIFVENALPVEYNQVLFSIDPF